VSLKSRLRSWAQAVFQRSRVEDETDFELRFHIQSHADDLVRDGVPPEDALRRARLAFGGVNQAREECREARRAGLVDNFIQDIRYGLRTLGKAPGFTAVAIGTLALAIGANTAIFSVVYAVMLKPLPYSNPGQLFTLFEKNPKEGDMRTGCSYPDFEEWQRQNHSFSSLAGSASHDLTLTGRGNPSTVHIVSGTADYFNILDAKPLLGRTFLPEDARQGAAPVVIVSENLWRGRLNGDPGILGESIVLDKRPFTVIGVMAASFEPPLRIRSEDVWIPLPQDPLFGSWIGRRKGHWLPVIGRLKSGVSMAQAQAEMDTISERLAKQDPVNDAGWAVQLVSLQKDTAGDASTALLVLLGSVGLVLLIACANIANLLLTRATARSKEIALRIALGAGRRRVIRQLLTESALLGILSGALGVCLAYWGVRALGSVLPPGLPRVHEIRVDASVLVFALVLSVAASFIFGLAPAFFAANSDVQSSLKEGAAQAGPKRGRQRLRNSFAVAEIALAMILLVGSGLLVRSFLTLTSVNPASMCSTS